MLVNQVGNRCIQACLFKTIISSILTVYAPVAVLSVLLESDDEGSNFGVFIMVFLDNIKEVMFNEPATSLSLKKLKLSKLSCKARAYSIGM